MQYVLATNSVTRSEALCEYLRTRIDGTDVVHAVNSQRGGDRTSQGELERGEEALGVVDARLSDVAEVHCHQIVRGNDPTEDLLEFVHRHDADEIVMGIRKRSATSKLVFGSVAQDILMTANVPMRVVPVPERR